MLELLIVKGGSNVKLQDAQGHLKKGPQIWVEKKKIYIYIYIYQGTIGCTPNSVPMVLIGLI